MVWEKLNRATNSDRKGDNKKLKIPPSNDQLETGAKEGRGGDSFRRRVVKRNFGVGELDV